MHMAHDLHLSNMCNNLQSCEMSILLHGAKSFNKILPQEKRVKTTILASESNKMCKNDSFGEQMLTTLSHNSG